MQKVKMMKKYADLIAEVGLNAGPKQEVAIYADVEMYDFVRYLVTELYKFRVRRVIVHYADQALLKHALMNTPDTRFALLAQEWLPTLRAEVERHTARLTLVGADVSTIKRLPIDKYNLLGEAFENILGPCLAKYQNNEIAHCTAVVPTKTWARELFPSLTPAQSFNRLWSEVYDACQISAENNSTLNYQRHINELQKRAERLTNRHFDSLKVSAGNKTALTLNLPLKHLWQSSLAKERKSNNKILRELPTEKIYVAPHSHGVNGVLYASRPITVQGQTVRGIRLNFEGGKIVDFGAETGKEALKNLIFFDDSSFRLGQITLVAPTGKTNRVFGNEILDANTAGYVTLGRSRPENYENGLTMDATKLRSHGLNQSRLRLNIPLGLNDLEVRGENDGEADTLIFAKGAWQI